MICTDVIGFAVLPMARLGCLAATYRPAGARVYAAGRSRCVSDTVRGKRRRFFGANLHFRGIRPCLAEVFR